MLIRSQERANLHLQWILIFIAMDFNLLIFIKVWKLDPRRRGPPHPSQVSHWLLYLHCFALPPIERGGR